MVSGRAYLKLFLLSVLCVWAVGGCARQDALEDVSGEHPLTLLMSLKNVLPGQGEGTKMTSEVTQSGGAFRGIERLYIVPFKTESSPEGDSFPVGDAYERLGSQNVVLGNVGISKSGLVENNNSHFFGSAFVPNEMNRVLVYGNAPDQGNTDSKDSKHTYGVLKPDGVDNPSGSDEIFFHLEPILETEGTDELSEAIATVEDLLEQLNVVMSLMGSSKNASILGIYDAVKRENHILACSYSAFDQLRKEIQTALIRIPYESAQLVQEIGKISQAVSVFSDHLLAAGLTFPANYGIPEGSFGFWWNGKEFTRLINGVNIALVEPGAYCYPPSLWYYANSPVKTSNNNDIVRSQYVSGNESWLDILAYYSDGNEVNAFTQAVAIYDPLQYGVGLLELSLLEPGPQAKSLIDECPLTGVIIGDQKDVKFDFLPGPGQSRYIYDNVVSFMRIGSTSGVSRTLVLPTALDAPVHFALEFQNHTNRKITCQQGEILPYSKFYLAGVLNPDGGRVFSSDLKTTVTVRIDSPKSAYNTVPDLHSPQLEIGVVAEMKWNQLTPDGIVLDF